MAEIKLDPRKLMKMPPAGVSREAGEYVAPARSTRQQHLRQEMVKSMYQSFKTYAEHDTYINYRDFQKYEILFSHDLRRRYLEGTAPADEITRAQELSNEFYNLIDPHRPIHIVDDEGHDVCPPLPPYSPPLNYLHGQGSQAVQIFSEAFEHDDNVPGGLGDVRKQKATAHLERLFTMAQNAQDMIQQIKNFDEMAYKFENQVFARQKPGQVVNPENQAKQTQGDTPDQNNGIDLDFEPVAED